MLRFYHFATIIRHMKVSLENCLFFKNAHKKYHKRFCTIITICIYDSMINKSDSHNIIVTVSFLSLC